MGKWLGILASLLLIFPGCGSHETPTRQNDLTPLTSIVISATVERLPAGVSTQLTATGNYSGLFTRDITHQVTWSSASANIADFSFPSSPGRIKAFTAGTVTITATLGGVSADSFLTVSDAVLTALTVAPPLPSLPLGKTQTFTVQGTFSDTTTSDLSADVLWSSSDVTVATISNDQVNRGAVTTFKMGTTTISAQFGLLAPASTTLTVTAAVLSSIEVTPASASLLSLTNKSFTAMGTFSDATTRDVTTEVTWESSAPAVATATANIVRAVAPGTTTISATSGITSGTANLTVTGGSLNSIALTLAQAVNGVLIKGTSSRVTARGNFSNNTSRDITGAVLLAVDSTNVSVTSVSGNLAWVQAVEVTSATPAKISASYGSVVAPGESLLTITAPVLNIGGLLIPEQALTLSNGSSGRLSLTGTFSSGSQDLTPSAEWSSASPAIATVANVGLDKGRVTALAAGRAVITASYAGQTATTTVTVAAARTLQSLTILPTTFSNPIIPGTEKQFRVEAFYTDGTIQDVTADAVWTIANVNVAKFSDQLSDPGLLVAVDAGTTTLTATFGGLSVTENITVFQ